MKVKLLRDARITRKAGEIVEVSPAERDFLLSTDGAIEIPEAVKAAAVEVEIPEASKKTTKTTKKK